jgi:hypothetical protein
MKATATHAWRLRAAQWLVGVLSFKLLDNAFDYVLYPFAIFKLGPLVGGIVMAALSLLDCLLLRRLYDWLKRDWLGIELVKGLRLYSGPSRWKRATAWLLGRGDAVAFVVLSLRFDPFITTAYLRHGAYNGLARRDWKIFLGSVVLSNAAWAFICFGGVEVFRRLWR